MAVGSEVSRSVADGNGVTTVFSVPFKFLANSDVKVYLVDPLIGEIPRTQDTDYSITGVGTENGGSITFLPKLVNGVMTPQPPPLSTKVVILRAPAFTQGFTVSALGSFPPQMVEFHFDRIVMMIQRLADLQSRNLKLSDSFAGTFDFEIPLVPNATLIVNANGNGLAAGPTVDEILLAVSAVEVATAKALEASASAASALLSESASIAAKNTAVQAALDAQAAALAAAAAVGVGIESLTSTVNSNTASINSINQAINTIIDLNIDQNSRLAALEAELSFTIANGVGTPTNVAGFSFAIGKSSMVVDYRIKRLTDTTEWVETGVMLLTKLQESTRVTIVSSDFDAGVTFTATPSGQVQYTSTTIPGTYVAANSKLYWKVRALTA